LFPTFARQWVGMDDLRKERLAINEALYRNVNEGIRAGARGRGGTLSIRCECGTLGCNRLFDVPHGVYEATRAESRRFLLLEGHDVPEVERVVERHDGFMVVEKFAESGDIAQATDPRSR
jgi:hypothetical protein